MESESFQLVENLQVNPKIFIFHPCMSNDCIWKWSEELKLKKLVSISSVVAIYANSDNIVRDGYHSKHSLATLSEETKLALRFVTIKQK